MRTYFVTLNWNTTELLKRMVGSVEKTTLEPHTWIIVDNGSDKENQTALYDWLHWFFVGDFAVVNVKTVGSGRWCRGVVTEELEALVIASPENVGCILGNNLAFDVAQQMSKRRSHEIVMVNTDVSLIERGWLSKVREWADKRPEVGIVGLEHSKGAACASAIFLDTNGNWYIHQVQTKQAEPAEGESVGLGLALIRWPVLEAGLRFDPAFKMYYKQDDDFTFKMRARLGLEAWVFPVDCIHWGRGSLKANDWQCGDARNRAEFEEIKSENQRLFAERWAWALRSRRATMEEEAQHLVQMKQMVEERRCEPS